MRLNLKDKLKKGASFQNSLSDSQAQSRIETVVSKTFLWMSAILFIAFGSAYGLFQAMQTSMISQGTFSILYWIGILGGFGIVLAMSFKWQSWSYSTLGVLFVVFGLLEGAGLSGIFMVYSLGSIYWAFLSTSILFVCLVGAEKLLNVDVTKMGSVLMVGLFALIGISIVNMFLQSPMLNIWISVFGILIFSGLVMYNMAMLKEMALMNDDRVEIIMALSLYLDFINLFLFILRLFGSRD